MALRHNQAYAPVDPGAESPPSNAHFVNERPGDSVSIHSTSHLAPSTPYNMPPPGTYPPKDAEQGHATYPPTPGEGRRPDAGTRPTNSRNSSWDILSGAKHLTHDVEHFDPRTASAPHLRMAEGDLPNNRVAKFYAYLLSASVITRWFIYIVPILALLWIPGILSFTAFPEATMADVNLRWWSIWFSVLWAGYWAALAASMLLPLLLRGTIGVVAVGTRRYIDWLRVLNRYVAIFGWAVACFASFKPLITNNNQHPDDSQDSGVQSAHQATSTIFKILFGVVLCAAILLAEKLLIQMIGSSYHQRSYADRLEEQRRNTRSLIILYQNSTDHAGRNDTLHDNPNSKNVVDPKRLLKNALKGVRGVAESTTQAFGNIASEIIGSSVLQPNSPQAMVATALSSANKTRLLARRLYYSFRAPGADCIVFNDIAQYFPSHEAAMDAFTLFDKDGNGDATRDEMELACMEIHRERLALAASMRDIDSAVGRLDNILMTLYVAVAIIVIAVTLDAELSTLIVGASTFLLALSWLIGGTAQEILTSIIFLFVKHMYDVGDRIEFDGQAYVVKEIRLLSTILIDVNKGAQIQAPNLVLNGKLITNIRRSPPMSEPFEFEVAYSTTFNQIEQLRAKMLAFVKSERRDFLPTFDVVVQDVPQQSKMILQASIKYKSNAQQGALKSQRRNKWVCALKESLADVKIFGPSGDPNGVADPTKYTLVPWEEVKAGNQPAGGASSSEPLIPRADWQLADRNAVILDDSRDVYGETDELHMTQPRARDEGRTRPTGSSALGTPGAGTGSSTARQQVPLLAASVFEMTGRPQ